VRPNSATATAEEVGNWNLSVY